MTADEARVSTVAGSVEPILSTSMGGVGWGVSSDMVVLAEGSVATCKSSLGCSMAGFGISPIGTLDCVGVS